MQARVVPPEYLAHREWCCNQSLGCTAVHQNCVPIPSSSGVAWVCAELAASAYGHGRSAQLSGSRAAGAVGRSEPAVCKRPREVHSQFHC